jgi:ribose 5-phosphate isomerase B
MATSTKDEVVRLVAEVLEQDPGSIRLEEHFINDLGASSLDIVTLVMRIEQHYMLGETPDSQLEQIQTVGDLVEMVRSFRDLGEPSIAEEVVDVAIASDHAGVELKAQMVEWLRSKGLQSVDLGPHETVSVDYPDFAALVAGKVVAGEATSGILICGSGIGMSIAANKVEGIRAALVSEPISARLCRQHNDANVLCLGARMIGVEMAFACADAFLHTEFTPGDDGRHRRRVQRMMALAKR